MDRTRFSYYEILGIPRESSEVEIKRAFRELARKYHPDMTPGMEGTRFRAIVEAYRVLSNPYKRQMYDRELARTATHFAMQY